MIWNYLKTALRNMLRYKVYATINIIGLAIGMACCILILLYVQRELKVDQGHEKGDRIYRILQEVRDPEKGLSFTSDVPGALGPALQAEIPEIQATVRMIGHGSLVEGNGKTFNRRLCLIDQSFFNIFTFPFVRGNPQTAFQSPAGAVITENTAKQFFGNADPMGQTLTIHNRRFQGDYIVTGVIQDFDYSTLRFQILITDPNKSAEIQKAWEDWQPLATYRPVQIYILLPAGYDPKTLEQKLTDFATRHLGSEIATNTVYHLQPLTRIYLYSRTDYGGDSRSYDAITQVYQMLAIGAILLLIACINFTNLSTAQSVGRAKEVGMRKVVGAYKTQLIRQFLSESLIMAFIALFLSLGLVELSLPTFNRMVGQTLPLNTENITTLLTGLIGITLITGLLAGCYPAFFLSAYKPVETLKGTLKTSAKSVRLRKGLVIFQFAISVFLIISTFSIHNQITHMLNQDLGFDPEHLILLPIFTQNQELVGNPNDRLSNQYDLIKTAFLQNPNIQKATALRFIPVGNVRNGGGAPRRIRTEGTQNQERQIPINEVDETFFDTFGIELISGRTFSPGLGKTFTSEFIINETAAKQFGWTDPIGKQIEWVGEGTGTVVGVVKDYHFIPLHNRIGPQAFVKRPDLFTYIGLKMQEGDLTETLRALEKTWQQFTPTQPFSYTLLEEEIDRFAYWGENRLVRISTVSTTLAILIACLGLFGLAAFSTHQRIKEIGIRKVLGASVGNIVLLLSKDFLILVALANLIAWPAAYYVMSIWLEQYPYRISLGVSIFVLSGLTAVLIALATVSWQAIKAARSNPVDALKYE